jgi:uncharacterized protein with ParB-like and HNH nuclease domain
MQELESLKSIFKDRLFKIPDYQRGYAWTLKQIQEFWEDVINLPIDRFHYTGVLSLKKVEENIWGGWNEERWLIENRGYKAFHVVDGQQRLTTFVIFLQALVNLVQNLAENKDKRDSEIIFGSFSLKEIKEEYLKIEKPPQYIIKTYKFGYEVDNPSFQYLKHRIFKEPNSGTIQETFYTLNLQNASNFFEENLVHYYQTYGFEEVELLFKKLTQNLMLNVYEIGDDFDVYVAFETMNNRGKKLSNLELLKNRLIYLTTLYSEEELNEDDVISLRGKINDAWKEVYFQLGRNKKAPLNDDDFLVAHWIMYFQYTREKGDDYIRFLLDEKFTPKSIYEKIEVLRNTIQPSEEIRSGETAEDEDVEIVEQNEDVFLRSKLTPKEIESYVNSLKAASVHWFNAHNPKNNSKLTPDEALWIDRLNRIGIIYFRPLVVASFLAKTVSPEERINLFQAIERFIFVTFRLGRAFSTYRNSEFYKASRELRTGEISIVQIIKNLNQRMDDYFYSKPDNVSEQCFDHTYFQKFIEKKFKRGGGFYHWNGLRYFLYEYEMEKVRARGSQKIDWLLFVKGEKDKVSIEHIYPQTPDKDCWGGEFEGVDEVHKMYLQGSLGNLLPLSQSINSSLQNDCFYDKKNPKFNDRNEKIRQGYHDGSHSEIEVSSLPDWTPDTILERGMKLLNFMERRWDLKFESDEKKQSLLFLKFDD